MNHDANLEPFRRSPGPATPTTPEDYYDLLPPNHGDNYLTPAQQDQIRELIAHATALARNDALAELDHYDEDNHFTRWQPQLDPGVAIAMFMLALVTVVAIIAIVAVLGMAVNTA